jgi:hypothetical protein
VSVEVGVASCASRKAFSIHREGNLDGTFAFGFGFGIRSCCRRTYGLVGYVGPHRMCDAPQATVGEAGGEHKLHGFMKYSNSAV